MDSPKLEDLIEFPCKFPIKIMGLNDPELLSEIAAIVSSHAPDFIPQQDISSKPSSKGNYLSVTATITAQSKAQLDKIYLALNNHKLIKITL